MSSQQSQSLSAPKLPKFIGRGMDLLAATPVRVVVTRGILALILLLAFRTIQAFPGMTFIQEGWFGLIWLIFALAWFPWKLASGFRVSTFEIYALLVLATGVLMGAWGAWRVFGQPWTYGVAAERSLGSIGIWLLLLQALRRGLIRLADLNAALLLLAWSTFILYSAMRLLLNPARFAAYGVGFVTFSIDGIASFKLPVYFIMFGVVYYAFRGIRSGRNRDYVLAAVLFLIGAQGLTERWLTISMAFTVLFFLFRWRSLRQFLSALTKLAIVAGAGLGVALLINPQFVSRSATKFSDAFSVVTTGSEGADSSANARLLETVMVLPYIERHPLLGNGVLSHQWQGGSHEMLGEMFYEADIGVVGIIYSYGIIGMLIFTWQYWFALRSAGRIGREISDPFIDATKGFVLFTAVYSVTTGIFVWDLPITFFFVVVLVAIEMDKSGRQPLRSSSEVIR